MPKDASGDNTVRLDAATGINVRDHWFGKYRIAASANSRLDRYLLELKRDFPSLVFETKDRWYWKLIYYFLLIVSFGKQNEFLSAYTTTIGMLIAFSAKVHTSIVEGKPGGDWEDRLWALLRHEGKHLEDFKRFGVFLMFVIYIFIFFPVGLAWGRAWIERKGYIESLRAKFVCDQHWAEDPRYRVWWIERFTGSSYIWQWPFKKQVAKWFDTELQALREADDKRQTA